MGAFLVNDNLLTDNNLIPEMWADHFEDLGTPSKNAHFDNGFLILLPEVSWRSSFLVATTAVEL